MSGTFDHVIALNEQHLRRLIRDYVTYHHDDRTGFTIPLSSLSCQSVLRKPERRAGVASLQ